MDSIKKQLFDKMSQIFQGHDFTKNRLTMTCNIRAVAWFQQLKARVNNNGLQRYIAQVSVEESVASLEDEITRQTGRIRTFEQMDRRKHTMRSALDQARNRAERIGGVAEWTAYGELMYSYRTSSLYEDDTL